jgi:hypothetical protein
MPQLGHTDASGLKTGTRQRWLFMTTSAVVEDFPGGVPMIVQNMLL